MIIDTLIIDTGSSNTWIGAGKAYNKTSTSHDTGNTVVCLSCFMLFTSYLKGDQSVSYGTGSFSGEEWSDTVTLGPGLIIRNQSIGVANLSADFNGFDGILGVGPVDLTSNSVSNTGTVPTVLDNLLSQGTISEEVLGIYYVPVSESSSNGELTLGEYDSSVITSSVKYVPLTTTYPASKFWGINQSISYGNITILNSTAGIVDTGTTLILIATGECCTETHYSLASYIGTRRCVPKIPVCNGRNSGRYHWTSRRFLLSIFQASDAVVQHWRHIL